MIAAQAPIADYPYLGKHLESDCGGGAQDFVCAGADGADQAACEAAGGVWTEVPRPPCGLGYGWAFPHGLIQDESAIFLRHYNGASTTLPSTNSWEPAELLAVWFYDEVAMAWYYFVPSWESTLTDLEYGNTYIVIVMDACIWPLPEL